MREGAVPAPVVRGRFAPSPSGRMHLGNVWCALLAWLSVRSQQGVMVLRIEDLDTGRCRPEYADRLMDDLRWLGLDWDEGPGAAQPDGPYYQSQCAPLYRRALAAVGRQRMRDVTDDCSIFELAGLPVRLVEGEYANRKITTREDLPAHAKEETAMRVGHGYDVHRLVEGRKLILGGVEIPYEKGLLGHSDADVLAHAVADALLGAAALGDIGKLFPDTDERYKGADSLVLLGHVAARVRQAGFAVENIDATVLCQRPKLAAHIPAMREKLAAACGMDAGDVSVKATTEEGLGFTGEGLGIAAHCVCLLRRTGGGR